MLLDSALAGYINHREDKFLRATNYKHYAGDDKQTGKRYAELPSRSKSKSSAKPKKSARFMTFGLAVIAVAAALIVPTTTLAPDVDAHEDSKVASYSIGDISEFYGVITDNCVEVTTAPETQEVTTVAAETEKETEESTEKTEETEADTKAADENSETENETKSSDASSVTEEPDEDSTSEIYSGNSSSSSDSGSGQSESSSSYLIGISNPDSSYSPKRVTLSSYDRAKLERLVMGEAGTMGYNGCALVAQAIRDAMNRSNTSSIDQIISQYQYYGSTATEPSQTVKEAVSYIFDQNGSAVQHRVLCFYTGQSAWHETQTFIVGCGSVRFFDLNY